MKFTKHIVLLALAFLAFAITSQAQSYSLQTTALNGGTNNIAATTTNSTVGVTITATRSSYLAVQPTFALTGSGTTAVVFLFDESLDNVNWTSGTQSLSITPAGTSTVTGIKSVAVNGVGFWRLNTIQNPNSTAITNLTVKYTTKNGL